MGYNSATFNLIPVALLGLCIATACQHADSHNSSDDSERSRSATPPCTCPPKPVEELAKQVNTLLIQCLSLSKMSVPIDGFTWTLVYAITSDNSCLRFQTYDSRCFQQTSLSMPRCSWSHSWVDLGPDFFPRFVSNVECRGSSCCRPRGRQLPEVKVLRRQNGCDENGEVWQEYRVPSERVQIACGCSYRNS